MKDRLAELRSRIGQDESLEVGDTLAYDNPAFQDGEARDMDLFFQEVAGLSLALRSLRSKAEDIEKKQAEVLCSTTEVKISQGNVELSKMKEQLTADAKIIQVKLNRIKNSLTLDRQRWTAEHRIRKSQLTVLTNRFQEIMTEHYINETKYVGKLKGQIMRQAELAGLNLQEDEINELMGSAKAPQIVGHDLEILKAQQHLAMAQERHRQLLDLEAQITELHSLFMQLDLLASEQQDVINSIEYNVINTMDYVSQSKEEVKKALKYQRQSRVAAAISAVLGLCACCTCLSCMSGVIR
ncbi:syntaxin-3-like [Mantella aurantiaca]